MLYDEAKHIFIGESTELLHDMEMALLGLEDNTGDQALINQIFRAAHTVKGSAGLFGYAQIIAFTHQLETLLDEIRKGLITIDEELISLLMQAKDHLQSLLEEQEGKATADLQLGEQIKLQLMAKMVSPTSLVSNSSEPVEPVEAVGDEQQYHLSIRLGSETFIHGFDPSSLFSNLIFLGTINGIVLVASQIPPLSGSEPQDCYLGWELNFSSHCHIDDIRAVFELMEDASIGILRADSDLQQFMTLAGDLPGDDAELAQLWIDCGTFERPRANEWLKLRTGGMSEDVVKTNSNQETVIATAAKNRSFIRVDAQKLDQLVNLVGELILSSAKLNRFAESWGEPQLIESVSDFAHALEDTRDTALGLRMVPIGETFARFNRVVRDTANEIGKKITLNTQGNDTELDKAVIEKITDPLTHMIRNALDHGIEMPGDRIKAGKPEQGVITLSARHQSGNIIITVSDDGTGLDRARILSKAIEQQIVKADESLSDNDIYQLIFTPGFSTAAQVGGLSGRGVGMDVVKNNIEALRGSIELESTPGQGSKTIIRLPLTLAIIDGLEVMVGQSPLIIPLDSVLECITPDETMRQCCVDTQDGHNGNECDYLELRGEVLPLVRLQCYFQLPYGNSSLLTSRTKPSVVVVESGKYKVGLLVSHLVGEMQAVIKPLGMVFTGLRGFSGFTILGTGATALILDIPMLIHDVIARSKCKLAGK